MSKLVEKKSYKSNSKTTANKPAMVTVIKRLTDELAIGKFKSGQAIKESVLAKKYGVSRNAIREALNQIVGWGLFEYIPYRGYQIKNFSIHNLLQWDELREALEPIAARRLAKYRPTRALELLKKYYNDMEEAFANMDESALCRADFNFHSCVVEQCGNESFSHLQTVSNLAASFYFGMSIMEANQDVVRLSEFDSDLRGSGKREDFEKLFFSTLDGHREMYESIVSGDADKAEKIFRHHTHNQVILMEKYIKITCRDKHFVNAK